MEQKKNELLQEIRYQLFHYPEMNGKQKIKYLVKRIVRPAHTPKRDAFFWPNALLAQGLETVGEVEILRKYYDLWIEKGMLIHNIDDVMNGYSLLYVYEKIKEEKYKYAADKLYLYLKEYSKSMKDTIPYRKGNPNHIYVDGIGMIVPFLCRYGSMFKEKEAIDLGIKQIREFLKYGMDDKTGLPYHGYDTKNGLKYGIIGWGRSLGWLLLALVDSIEYIEEEKIRREMIDVFQKLTEAVMQYIRSDGYFCWQLEAVEGPKDTSATAMIGYALKKGKKYLICEEKEKIFKKIENALLESCNNGRIYDCSGECHGFSQYPQIYGAYPWSLGPGVRMLFLEN